MGQIEKSMPEPSATNRDTLYKSGLVLLDHVTKKLLRIKNFHNYSQIFNGKNCKTGV